MVLRLEGCCCCCCCCCYCCFPIQIIIQQTLCVSWRLNSSSSSSFSFPTEEIKWERIFAVNFGHFNCANLANLIETKVTSAQKCWLILLASNNRSDKHCDLPKPVQGCCCCCCLLLFLWAAHKYNTKCANTQPRRPTLAAKPTKLSVSSNRPTGLPIDIDIELRAFGLGSGSGGKQDGWLASWLAGFSCRRQTYFI